MVHAELEEAKTQLSSLIAQVEAGEEVILSRAGKPVARIVRWSEPAKAKRQLGLLSSRIVETTGVWDEDCPPKNSQFDRLPLLAASAPGS